MPAAKPSYSARKFLLELEGGAAGFVRSMEGGNIVSSVVEEMVGSHSFPSKHLGQVRVEDFVVEMGLDMDKSVSAWIAAMWSGKSERRDGQVGAVDQSNKIKESVSFSNALLKEVTSPALDGASKEAGSLTLRFSPESIRRKKSSGEAVPATTKTKTKMWLPSNFRLEIEGLNCQRVAKVDGFTIKQSVVEERSGNGRIPAREPGRIEFPNLRISLAEVETESWHEWFDDFVVGGNNDSPREKKGSIAFLAADLKTELGRINLSSLGIFKLASERVEAGSDRMGRLVAELYCEQMELKLSAPGGGGGPRKVEAPSSRRGTTLTVPRVSRPA